MKYLAQVDILHTGRNLGCYRFDSNSLDEIREWAKRVGKPGDELIIQPNGKNGRHARKFVL